MVIGGSRFVSGARTLLWSGLWLGAVTSSGLAVDRYVDDDSAPGGSGLSWGEAVGSLQEALGVSRFGDRIHIAQGTYRPTAGADRSATFVLLDGVTLLGGYAGVWAADPDERDSLLYPTMLSGEIGDPTDVADNSFTILTATGLAQGATVDGLILTGGSASDASPFSASGRGGAMYVSGAASLVVRDCRFTGNAALGDGGAMYVSSSEVAISQSSFAGNTGLTGGGVHCAQSLCTLVSTTLTGNVADRGGALFNRESLTTLTNTVLTNNVAQMGGGAVFNENGDVALVHCTATANEVVNDGGLGGAGLAMHDDFGLTTARVVNSVFWGNVDGGPVDALTQFSFDGGALDVTYTCVEDAVPGDGTVYAGAGNTDEDPLFVDLEGRLDAGSPCNDAGDNDALPLDEADIDGDLNRVESLPSDRDGNQRRTNDGLAQDRGNAGALGLPIVDMGAFEVRAFSCIIEAPAHIECVGSQTVVTIDGSASSSPDNHHPSFHWDIDCSSSSPTDPVFELILDTSAGCPRDCLIELTLDDGVNPPFGCYTAVTITDTTPPTALDDFAVTDEDQAVVIDVLDNDTDLGPPIPLKILVYRGARNGTLVYQRSSDMFLYTPNEHFGGEDMFAYSVDDDAGNSSSAVVRITIDAVADAPMLGIGPASGDEDTAIGLTIDAQLVDVDGSETLTVVLDGVPAGAVLSAGADDGGGRWTVPGADLVGLTITPPLHDHADFSLRVTAVAHEISNDNEASTTAAGSLDVHVRAINDAPVLSIPGTVSVEEDTAAALSGVGVTDIDVDEGTGELELSLGVGHGVLTLAGVDGLTFLQGDGTANATMTFRGSAAAINNALSPLVYHGDPHYNGDDVLGAEVNDLGNTGFGGSSVDAKTIAISVAAVNDAPTIVAPGGLVVDEDTDLVISGVSIGDLDVNATVGVVRVGLSALHGVLSLSRVDDLFFLSGSGLADRAMSFEGTIDAINAALTTVTYSPDLNHNGPETIGVTVDDLGGVGLGGAMTTAATLDVFVTPVNDAPVALDDPFFATRKATALILSQFALMKNDYDVDGDAVEFYVVRQPQFGTITSEGGSPLLFTFAPKPGFEGFDRFAYTITDLHGGFGTGTVTIGVGDAGRCMIGGIFYDPTDLNPANDCEYCISVQAVTEWSARPVGSSCGDPDYSACNAADTCDGAGVCLDNLKAAGVVCRAGAGDCDIEESCDGVTATCPADGFVPLGVLCRAAVGDCDRPEACSGAGSECPSDLLAPMGMECRAAVGLCDVAELCVASSPHCPSDGYRLDGTSCDDGVYCNGVERCRAGACMDGKDPCDRCDEGTERCLCDDDDDCDDDLDCTDEHCHSTGGYCEYELDADACLIDGACFDDGDRSSTTGCSVCDTHFDQGSWTAAGVGTPCGDDEVSACTAPDTCDGASVCQRNDRAAGTACDDGLFCNGDADTCSGGFCVSGGIDPCPAGTTCNESSDRCKSSGGGGGAGFSPADSLSGSGVTNGAGMFERTLRDAGGRAFAMVSVTGAASGIVVIYRVSGTPGGDPGPGGGTVIGFGNGTGLGRWLTLTTPSVAGGFVAVVGITFSADELAAAGVETGDVMLHVLNTDAIPPQWEPVGRNVGESAPTGELGDCGYEIGVDGRAAFWAIVDHFSSFAVGEREGARDDGPDRDGDGVTDAEDNCPRGSNADQADADDDGVGDDCDRCPDDGQKSEAGRCGCGEADDDADSDGTPDCDDECPLNAMKTDAGVCGCDGLDEDEDEDGVADCVDVCGDTDAGMAVDDEGCSADQAVGQPVPGDGDGDGVGDEADLCPGTEAGAAVDEAGCSADQVVDPVTGPRGCGAGAGACGAMGMVSLWVMMLGLGLVRFGRGRMGVPSNNAIRSSFRLSVCWTSDLCASVFPAERVLGER